MATTTQPSLDSIEQRRLQLEENTAKLRKALEHWSTWEIEYAMLKEELEKADSPSTADMVEIGRDLDGTLVNEKEVQELLGKDLKIKRTANQVVDMIARRIDYVQQNRNTVEKQLEKAEKQLEGVSILTDPGLTNEEGLPMMDIEEELDDNDQVKSSSVSQPGKVAPELMDALRKAGVYKADQEKSESQKLKAENSSKSEPSSSSVKSPSVIANSSSPTTEDKDASTGVKSEEVPEPPKKKSVAFAEDVDVKTFEKQKPESPPRAKKLDLRAWNLKPGSRVYELGDDEEISATHTIPTDESMEDAELRRDMLQYGLEEVGQVVGEMDLDEEAFDDEYEEDSNESEEDEDEHGRSTRPYLTDAYRQQMLELEKKLNARMVENIGPRPDLHPLADVADDVRSLRIRKDDEFDETISKPEAELGEKKTVSFANTPNGPEAPQAVSEQPSSSSSPAPTIADTIVEHTAALPQPSSTPSKPAKVSRFKSARAASIPAPPVLPNPPMPEPPALPTGPKGRTLANTVVEHTPGTSEHHAPDEFDTVMLNREITTEYHKMRNKMIQQQGGFKETEAEAKGPLMEERNGKPKKVSRFMAARLKAEGL